MKTDRLNLTVMRDKKGEEYIKMKKIMGMGYRITLSRDQLDKINRKAFGLWDSRAGEVDETEAV